MNPLSFAPVVAHPALAIYSAPEPLATFADLLRVRGRLPAVVPVPHGQRGHLARARRATSRSHPACARLAHERVLPRVRARCRFRSASCSTATGRGGSSRCCWRSRRPARSLFALAETLAGLDARARDHRRRRVRVPDGAAQGASRCGIRASGRPRYAGWIMVAGGIGALAATAPLEFALRVRDWRTCSRALSAVTLVVGAVDLRGACPTSPSPAQPAGIRAQFAGVRARVPHPRFWWIAPLGALRHGLVHGDPGPVGGAVDDGSRGPHARRRRRTICSAMNVVVARRLRCARPVRHAARAARHPRAPLFAAASRSTSWRSLLIAAAACPASSLWWSLYGLGRRGEHARLHRAERGVPPRARGPHEHRAQPA